jgi:hypothetical protein
MDSPQLPTPYKLCRLAAALRNPEAENDPLDAIRKALGLWFATLRELTKAERLIAKKTPPRGEDDEEDDEDDYEEFINKLAEEFCPAVKAERGAELAALEKRIPLLADAKKPLQRGTSEEDSELMQWVNANALRHRDKFKSFGAFMKAWTKYCEANHGLKAQILDSVAFARIFLENRVDLDRKREAERKRKERTVKTAANKAGNKAAPTSKESSKGRQKRRGSAATKKKTQ